MALYKVKGSKSQSGGHWVTIKDGRWKGQHVFIRDGQTFDQAIEERKKYGKGLDNIENRPVANKLAKQKQKKDNNKYEYKDGELTIKSKNGDELATYGVSKENYKENPKYWNEQAKRELDEEMSYLTKDLEQEFGDNATFNSDILHKQKGMSYKEIQNMDTEEYYKLFNEWKNGSKKEPNYKVKQGNPLEDLANDRVKEKQETLKNRQQLVEMMKEQKVDKFGEDTIDDLEFKNWRDQNYIYTANNDFESLKKNRMTQEERDKYMKENGLTLFSEYDEYKYLKSQKEQRTPGFENTKANVLNKKMSDDDEYQRYKDSRLYGLDKVNMSNEEFNNLDKKYLNKFGNEPIKAIQDRDKYAVIQYGGIHGEYDTPEEALEQANKLIDANRNSKYKKTKHEGFGDYNDDYIPVYNDNIDYTGDFSRANLKSLSDEELKTAYNRQMDELEKAQSESIGDQRTRNGRMDKIFKNAKVNKYSQGVEKIQSELDNRNGANWREQIKANNDQLEKDLENYKNTHDMRYESEGYYELFRENERKNAKIKREEPNEKYEFVEAYAGYKAKRDKLENITRNADGSTNWDNYKETTWTGKEYTNDEFLENLEDENWHTERKMLLDAGLTNKQMEFVKNNTTFRNGSPSLDREITEELIKGAKGQKYRTPEQIKTDRTNKETNELTTALRHMEQYGKDNSDIFKNYKYSSYDEMTNRYKQLTGKDFEKGKVNIPYDPKKTYTLQNGTPINQDLMKQWYDGRKRSEVEGSIKVDKDMIMSATPENREMYNALVKETEKYLKGIPTTKSRISDEYTTHDWKEGYGSHYGEPSWKGSKSDSGLYGKDKIKAIDDVVKKAYPEIKTGRRTHQGGYTDSFSYTVKGSTQPMVRKFEDFSDSEIENLWNSGNNKSWYKTKEDFTNQLKNELSQKSLSINEYNIDDDYRLTPYAKQLFKDISKVSNAYNYDESDSMTDYFHTGHYINYHLENNPLLEDKKSSKSKAMGLSQLVQSYVDRGYSEETARKMAKQAVNKRKRK